MIDLANGATACVSAGTTLPYFPCSDTANPCQPGNACLDGICKPLCEDATSTSCTNGRCRQVVNNATPVPGYFACTRTCNPLNPQQDDAAFDSCGPGVNCLPTSSGDSDCISGSTPTGTAGVNCRGSDGQGDSSLCAIGHVCIELTAGVFECARFCRLPGECGTDGVCRAFGTRLCAGPQEIGYCAAAD